MHLCKFELEGEEFSKKRESYRSTKKERSIRNRKNSKLTRADKDKDLMYRRKYKISLYDVINMKNEQKNKCFICENERPLVVDHCHDTGKVRKLLCNPCNVTLGQINENTGVLKRMIKYIEDWCPTKDK
jgi:hypothetical protein